MASMAEIVSAVRLHIADFTIPYVYDDETIRSFIINNGLPRTNILIGTNFTSEDEAIISPEPTGDGKYLIELATAYAILVKIYNESSGKAIEAKEGSSSINLRGQAEFSGKAAQDMNKLIKEVTDRILQNGVSGVYIV